MAISEKSTKTPAIPTFDAATRDQVYWETIDEIAANRQYSNQDMLRNWQSYVMRRDIPRFLSHYELFKEVINLPGCIVELGVFKGNSFFTWSMLMETFVPFDRSRKVFGFDSFEGLPDLNDHDGSKDKSIGKIEGGYKCTAWEVQRLTDIHNSDNLIPGTKRANLIVGNIQDTIPKFLEDNPGLKIALLHFDVDLYEATKYGLEMLYPLVLKGGVVCFDEYGLIPWQGETRAADEYFAKIGEQPKILKHHFAQTPHGYFIK